MSDEVVEAILSYNAGRDPERLRLKYASMASSAFSFLRGSCHLYYQRMVENGLSPGGPAAWSCGDLHLENYGTYLGGNQLAYFDVNDFDEAALAPCTWDITRLVTSLIVADTVHGVDIAAAMIESWRQELYHGKPRWIERKTADGIIGNLLSSLKGRRKSKFLDKRTIVKKGRRQLTLVHNRTLQISDTERTALAEFCRSLATDATKAHFFEMLDAARRIAGTGSLGVYRYILLVEGSSSPNDNVLLDLKEARPTSVGPRSPYRQPIWRSESDRIVSLTDLCQAVAPQFLRPVDFDGKAFVLKELQPTEDRLDLVSASNSDAFVDALLSMARLAAWVHLRSSGRQGSVNADELIDFAGNPAANDNIMKSARELARLTFDDWRVFATAYATGAVPQSDRPLKRRTVA